MKRIAIHTADIEVDKPDGGGQGRQSLYVVDIEIDGVHALSLRRHHFKQPGQMEEFVELMKELTR